ASAMCCATRPFRTTHTGAVLFDLFGGEERGRIPAYVATGAIALAFLFSLIGFIKFSAQQSDFETQIGQYEKNLHQLRLQEKAAQGDAKEKLEEEIESEEKRLKYVEDRWTHLRDTAWNGNFDWLRIR